MSERVDIVPALCSVTFRDLEPAEVIDLCAEAGLEAIEWGGDSHVVAGDIGAAQTIAERCGAAGLRCPSYGTYLGMSDDLGEPTEACETAVALGADNVRVWARFGKGHNADAESRAAVVEEMATFAEAAATHGLTVGIEFHAFTLTETAASAKQLVAEIGADHVYSYWQPIYWDDSINEDPDRQLDELRTIHAEVSNVHVYWWRGLARLPLQAGESTWLPALRELHRSTRWVGPRHAFLEFLPDDDTAVLVREAATLRGWLATTDPADDPGTRT